MHDQVPLPWGGPGEEGKTMQALRNAALLVLGMLLVAACWVTWSWREPTLSGFPPVAHAAPDDTTGPVAGGAERPEAMTGGAPAAEQATAAFLGDSYTAGIGASEPVANHRWTHVVADRMGWQEVNLGRGGTGYRTVAANVGCGFDFCPSYIGMLPELTASNPDVIVISGGRNDGTADIRREANQLFYNVTARFPDAHKYVTSPVWDAGTTPDFINQQTNLLQQVAQDHGFLFLDIGQPLAGNPDMIAPDGLHPNDDGHEALANAVVGALTAPAPQH